MPVVLTDHTNRTWCMEQPNDGYLHVGFVGQPGPRVEDLLEFVQGRDKQFKSFLDKKLKGTKNDNARNRNLLRRTKTDGDNSVRAEENSVGTRSEGR